MSQAKPKGSPRLPDRGSLPDEEIELVVEEDRMHLVLESLASFSCVLALLLGALALVEAAGASSNMWLVLLALFALTAVWFISRHAGRLFRRWMAHTPVMELGERHLFVCRESKREQALCVSYESIGQARVQREGGKLRLLLKGPWVEHPSGYEYVAVSRPFAKESLDSLEEELVSALRAHGVSVAS